MRFRRAYYQVKPYSLWWARIWLRRWWAARQRRIYKNAWPINEAAGQVPEGWPGWPEAKQFALVLTHDVEGPKGLERCLPLMELESGLGFHSSFNFVPERYTTPKELRDRLTGAGFEVAVHDLKHDGKLYFSRSAFRKGAQRINQYLNEWGAVGFRAGFMLHELEWHHDLNILYDTSTFDTDPFEPQPDGMNTIFPFWVPGGDHGGYVELPYTLVQDFSNFVVLREKTIDVWKRKLDWIASKGGMALFVVHPDYTNFGYAPLARDEYPVCRYEELLAYVKDKYNGHYWHALPREVAAHVVEHRKRRLQGGAHRVFERVRPASGYGQTGRKIWIDLDNTPHVPFFKPIIQQLEKRGYTVLLTARDAFQVCELATHHGLNYTCVGRHFGKNMVLKLIGLLLRAFQLLPIALREKPVLGLSHGARSQILVCNLLRIPSVLIMDYEHAKSPPLARPQWEIVPDVLRDDTLYSEKEKVRKYSGIKEDVYASELKPDPAILRQLNLQENDIIITVRPPATEAHYHNSESETLFTTFMNRACDTPDVRCVLLPRNKRQEAWLRTHWPQWFTDARVVVPPSAVDGLNLLWHSDLVVSGGGTMNREAAALGVPVYSIFRGKIGAVDRQLQAEGRLVLVEGVNDVQNKIAIERRRRPAAPDATPRKALRQILGYIEEIVERQSQD